MTDKDQIVSEVADRVRELLADAERRAEQIIRAASEDAKRIRERAEAEGQERLAEVRKALGDLEGRLAAAQDAPPRADGELAGETGGEVEPGPVTVPEPSPDPVPEPAPPPIPEPGPVTVPEPTPERVPEPTPPPDEARSANGGDAVAARLVAMNMALAGSSREEIDAALADGYEIDDRETLIDEVLAKTAG